MVIVAVLVPGGVSALRVTWYSTFIMSLLSEKLSKSQIKTLLVPTFVKAPHPVLPPLLTQPGSAGEGCVPLTTLNWKSLATTLGPPRKVVAALSDWNVTFTFTLPVLLISIPTQALPVVQSLKLVPELAESVLIVVVVVMESVPKLTFLSTEQPTLVLIVRFTLPLAVALPVATGPVVIDNWLSLFRLRMVPNRLTTIAANNNNAKLLLDKSISTPRVYFSGSNRILGFSGL